MDGPIYEQVMSSDGFVGDPAPQAEDGVDADVADDAPDGGVQSSSSDDGNESCSLHVLIASLSRDRRI